MKHKSYVAEVNYDLLHEELEALPGYLTLEAAGRTAHYSLGPTLSGVEVGVEDHLDFPDAVIASHDHTKKSKAEADKEKKEEDKQKVLDKLDLTKDQWEALQN